MIITRTPFRISFAGGGSDLPAYYKRSSGAVLSTTINKYMYLSIHPYFDAASIHVKYSETELVREASDLQHPILRALGLPRRMASPGPALRRSLASIL